MNDQNNTNNPMVNMGGQSEEFQKAANDALAARMLERVMSLLSDEEIEEMKALPQDDPSAVEVFINSKFSKEELETMAKEELEMIKDRLVATMESAADDAQLELDAQEVLEQNPIEDVDGPTS